MRYSNTSRFNKVRYKIIIKLCILSKVFHFSKQLIFQFIFTSISTFLSLPLCITRVSDVSVHLIFFFGVIFSPEKGSIFSICYIAYIALLPLKTYHSTITCSQIFKFDYLSLNFLILL